MMRVLLTVAEMALGGAERMVAQLANGLTERGHQVMVLAAPGPSDALLHGEVARIATPDPRTFPEGVQTALAWARCARRFRPDVVHAQNVRATLQSVPALRTSRRRIPLVASFQGVADEDLSRTRMIFLLPDMVICVSRELERQLIGRPRYAPRTCFIPNGVPFPVTIDPGRARALKREFGIGSTPVISMVSRLVPQKNHALALAAFARLMHRGVTFKALLAGTGPLLDTLRARRDELGLQELVAFLGPREDARDLIALADVVLFSSRWEGLSLVALEALAAGVPVVTTPAQGMDELLSTGGGLVAPAQPDELAAVLGTVLADSKLRRNMSIDGSATIARGYTIGRTVSQHETLYRELLARGAGPPLAVGRR